jgi:site-specific recombinase XerD
VVLSPDEVARLLEAAPGPKYKAALSAAYAAGLRVCEVVALKVSDIDSERLLLRIEQGKGYKDRFAMLSRFSWRYTVLSKDCRLRSFGYSLFLLSLSMQRARLL